VDTFKSFQQLTESLKESGQLVFNSKPKRLKLGRVHLLAVATGDFNPHYCHPEFAEEHSFFKSTVSHGIGIIARAEAEFVPLLQKHFGIPIETIALGYAGIRYRSPLKIGERYQYRFEITGARIRKTRCDLTCHMVCEVLGSDARVVAEADWMPSIIEHPSTEATREYLRPKSYVKNLFEVFGIPAINWSVVATFACFFAVAIVLGTLFSNPVHAAELNQSLMGEWWAATF
jgi:acyl dehydratase